MNARKIFSALLLVVLALSMTFACAEPATYNLTVERNRPLTEAARGYWGSVNPESIMVDDIPALIAHQDNADSKPIFVFVHGGGQSKEQQLNSMNVVDSFNAIFVSFDGGACGESPRGAMTDGESICQAVEDIDKLIAYCSTIPGADLGRIFIEGGSFGGAVTLAYLAYGAFTPIMAVPMIPCADFTMYKTAYDNGEFCPAYYVHGSNPRTEPNLSPEELAELLASYSPIDQAERMSSTFILSSTGLQDSAYNVESCKALEARFQELGNTNYDFRFYDIGHDVPMEFVELRNELVSKYVTEAVPVENAMPAVAIVEK